MSKALPNGHPRSSMDDGYSHTAGSVRGSLGRAGVWSPERADQQRALDTAKVRRGLGLGFRVCQKARLEVVHMSHPCLHIWHCAAVEAVVFAVALCRAE